MSLFAPVYYSDFTCIAGNCRHSCCIGWEIDIDPRSLARYNKLPPKERKKILSQTVTQKGTTSFRLAKDGRCPFLTDQGLCQLILTHGEGILCDICREHPRFYNAFTSRSEVGLGLCCEEAARLILTETRPFSLICLEEDASSTFSDPFEADFFATREEIFALITNRSLPLSKRIDEILRRFDINGSVIYANAAHWQKIYRNLERLDPHWDIALDQWENSPAPPAWEDRAVEQLIAYFLYRHLADAVSDGLLKERIAFALLSAEVICSIAGAVNGSCDNGLAALIDAARAYSAEVEYNEEAVAHLWGELSLLL